MRDATAARTTLAHRPAATAFVAFAVAMSLKALYAWFPGAASSVNDPSAAPVGGSNRVYVVTWLALDAVSAAILAAPAWKVWEREQWFFKPEFHNAFLDILVGPGVVGVLFYLAILGGAAMVLTNRSLDARCIDVLIACLIVFIIGNATEFQLLAHNTNATLFLLYCFFVAGRRYPPPAPCPEQVGRRPAVGPARAPGGAEPFPF